MKSNAGTVIVLWSCCRLPTETANRSSGGDTDAICLSLKQIFFFFCLSNVFEWLLSGSIMSCGEISSSCLISSMLCDFPYICCFVQVCAAHDKTFLTFYYNEVISLSEFSSETRSTCMSVGTRSEYSWYLASSVVLKSRGHHQWNEGKNRKCKKTFLKMMTSWVWRKSFKV